MSSMARRGLGHYSSKTLVKCPAKLYFTSFWDCFGIYFIFWDASHTTVSRQRTAPFFSSSSRDRPLANGYSDVPASCKWSFGCTGLLQVIIWRGQRLANDHLEGPASCKLSLRGTGLSQMIIRMDRPLANDCPEGLASCK